LTLVGWIRIRVRNADPDPDPGGQELHAKKEKRNVLFSSAGSSWRPKDKYIENFGKIFWNFKMLQFVVIKCLDADPQHCRNVRHTQDYVIFYMYS
jgi:hypothetical protein